MAFPIMNAEVNSMALQGKQVVTISPLPEVATSAVGYPILDIPAVVDVSGMEFGMTVLLGGGSTATQTIASGASTVEMIFSDSGSTGTTTPADLHGGDTFSNTVTGGWTVGLVRTGLGTSTTDLDADDVVSLHVVANLTGAAGIGQVGLKVAFIYGKPGAIS